LAGVVEVPVAVVVVVVVVSAVVLVVQVGVVEAMSESASELERVPVHATCSRSSEENRK
jgi:hypothetical protein